MIGRPINAIKGVLVIYLACLENRTVTCLAHLFHVKKPHNSGEAEVGHTACRPAVSSLRTTREASWLRDTPASLERLSLLPRDRRGPEEIALGRDEPSLER